MNQNTPFSTTTGSLRAGILVLTLNALVLTSVSFAIVVELEPNSLSKYCDRSGCSVAVRCKAPD
jgi:hypothetical protein